MAYNRWGDAWAPGSWGSAWGTGEAPSVDNLVAQNIATGLPVITQPQPGQIHVLSSLGLITGGPVISQASLEATFTNALIAQNIATLEAFVNPAELAQTHVLTAREIETLGALISQAEVFADVTHELIAESLLFGTPEITQPSTAVTNNFEVSNILTDQPVIRLMYLNLDGFIAKARVGPLVLVAKAQIGGSP